MARDGRIDVTQRIRWAPDDIQDVCDIGADLDWPLRQVMSAAEHPGCGDCRQYRTVAITITVEPVESTAAERPAGFVSDESAEEEEAAEDDPEDDDKTKEDDKKKNDNDSQKAEDDDKKKDRTKKDDDFKKDDGSTDEAAKLRRVSEG